MFCGVSPYRNDAASSSSGAPSVCPAALAAAVMAPVMPRGIGTKKRPFVSLNADACQVPRFQRPESSTRAWAIGPLPHSSETMPMKFPSASEARFTAGTCGTGRSSTSISVKLGPPVMFARRSRAVIAASGLYTITLGSLTSGLPKWLSVRHAPAPSSQTSRSISFT